MANIKMEERKTVKVLKKLDKNEFRKFNQLLGHGYFKTSKNVVLLISFLSRYYPDFSDKNCNNTKAIKFIYRNTQKEITTNQLNNLFVKAFPLVELFLTIEQLQNNKVIANQLLAHSYNQRGLNNQFKISTVNTLDILEEARIRDASYYDKKADLNDSLYFHPHSDLLNINSEVLEAVVKNKDLAYIIKKLRYGCEILQSKRFRKEGYDFKDPILKDIIRFANKQYSKNPIIQMYLDIIHLTENEFDLSLMEKLVNDFSEHCTLLDLRSRLGLLNFLTNELIYQETKGILNHALKLKCYKLGDKNDCLIYNNSISSQVFINICLTANRVGDSTYFDSFLNLNSKFLIAEERKYIVNFCRADSLFFQGKYNEAFQLFNSNYNGSPESLRYRSAGMLLLLKYETFLLDHSYDEILRNSIESYIRNFQSDRQGHLTNNKKTIYLALGQFVKIIFKEKLRFLNGTTDQHIIQRTKIELLEKLSSKNGIAAKWWLTQKINQL